MVSVPRMTRSLRGRSRLYRPSTRVPIPPRSAAAVPTLPLTGYWQTLENFDWSALGSVSFDAAGVNDDWIVITDGFYHIRRPRNGSGWTLATPDLLATLPNFDAAYFWTNPLAAMPDGRFFSAGPYNYDEFVLNDYVGLSYAYDPDSDTFTELTPPPPASWPDGGWRFLYRWVVVGDHAYALGGFVPNTFVNDANYDLDRYNLVTDTWDRLAPQPIAGAIAGAWWDRADTIWALIDDSNPDFDNETHVLNYSISGDTWTDRTDLQPTINSNPLDQAFEFVRLANDRILAMDGSGFRIGSGAGISCTDAWIWDPYRDEVTQVDSTLDPFPRAVALQVSDHAEYGDGIALVFGGDMSVRYLSGTAAVENFTDSDGLLTSAALDLSWGEFLTGNDAVIRDNAMSVTSHGSFTGSEARAAIVTVADAPKDVLDGSRALSGLEVRVADLGTPNFIGTPTTFSFLLRVAGTNQSDWSGIGVQFQYSGHGTDPNGDSVPIWQKRVGTIQQNDSGLLTNLTGFGFVSMFLYPGDVICCELIGINSPMPSQHSVRVAINDVPHGSAFPITTTSGDRFGIQMRHDETFVGPNTAPRFDWISAQAETQHLIVPVQTFTLGEAP